MPQVRRAARRRLRLGPAAVPDSLEFFEQKWANRDSTRLDFSGVWRFRELLPFVPNGQIVTIGEGQTLLQQQRPRRHSRSA